MNTHMTTLKEIGFRETEEGIFFGETACPVINRDILRKVELETSYKGCTIHSIATYKTPIGVLRGEYHAWGAALDHSSTKWDIVAPEEIDEALKKYNEAKDALERLVGPQP
jgi:hypothetical protein